VVIINDSKKKVEITYPCEWKYKVIGEEKGKIEDAVQSIISKTSNKGNYHSYELRTLVHNKDDRTELFRQLKEHDDVKMVL